MPTQDSPELTLRMVEARDVLDIAQIDAVYSGAAKPDHWARLLAQQVQLRIAAQSHTGRLVGYVFGDVRAFEFGSPAVGWIYAIAVDCAWAHKGVGGLLIEAACDHFAALGIDRVRTMVQKDSVNLLRFFRAEGFAAGPFVELERSTRRV